MRGLSNIERAYTLSPDAWQTKIQAFARWPWRFPWPWPWFFIGIIEWSIAMTINWFAEGNLNATPIITIDAALLSALGNAVVYIEQQLDQLADVFPELVKEDEKTTKRWVRRWYHRIFWSLKPHLICGILCGILFTMASIVPVKEFYSSTISRSYALVLAFILGMLCGSGLWVIIGIARMMSSLARDVRVRVSIFDTSASPLRAAGNMLWKTSLVASIVYLLGISPVFVCGMKLGLSTLFVYVGFGLFLILYFVIPQMNVHRALVRVKRMKMRSLVEQIDNSFDKVAQAPTPENIGQLRDLFHLQHVVHKKSEWSFGISEILAIMGTVIIPIIVFVLDRIFK